MEQLAVNNPDKEPDEAVLAALIGDKMEYWQEILSYLHENYSNISEEWKFYRDVKAWFFRALWKKKTIFWFRPFDEYLKLAFWFGDKAEPLIEASSLPGHIKTDFQQAKKVGTMGRCIVIDVMHPDDLLLVQQLIELKIQLK